jgi:protein-tyrosine-phosphatase
LNVEASTASEEGADDVHLLFVCTGNTCRSPMAAFFARAHIHNRQLPWTVESAGLFATPGLPITAAAANALIHRQIPLQPHQSQPVSEGVLARSNLILAMTKRHADELRRRFPEAAAKVVEFGQFAHGKPNGDAGHCDIVDPYGQSDEHYDACATQIELCIQNLLNHLTEEDGQ